MFNLKENLSERENRPLIGILILGAVIYLVGINWGLPHTISWQSDSLAPMRPLKGMFSLYSFGYFHKYPLVHSLILSIVNIPVVAVYGVIYLIGGGSPNPGIFAEAIQNSEPLATVLILEDRLVGIIFALGLVYNIFLIGKKLFTREAGFFAALFVVLNQGVNHLAHVAKVEVPYLFWATLAIYALIWAIETSEKKYFIYSAIFSGLCYGSKDQGYAFFVLPFLLVIIILPIYRDLKNREINKIFWKENFLPFAIAFWGTFIVVENIVLNWSGFMQRIDHLTGDAGFRSAAYPETFLGNIGMLWGSFVKLNELITPVIVLFLVVGLAAIIKNKKRGLFYTLPILVSLSFYLTFLMIVRQTESRFIVSLAIFLTPYAGYGASILFRKFKKGIIFLLFIPLLNTLVLNFTLLNDPRYEMEAFMMEEMSAGNSVEFYSYEQHICRFPDGVNSIIVKSPPEDFYNLSDRAPDYILLTSKWYMRYVEKPEINDTAFKYGVVEKMKRFEEQGYTDYFNNLINNKYDYTVIKRADAHLLTGLSTSLQVPNHLILLKRNGLEN